MSFTAVGLLTVQSVWLKNAVHSSHEIFSAQVSQAASDFITHLEKIELNETLQKKRSMSQSLQWIDSLNNTLQNIQNSNPDIFFNHNIRNIMEIIEKNEESSFIVENENSAAGENEEEQPKPPVTSARKDKRMLRNLQNAYNQIKEQRDFLIYRSQITDEMLQSLLSDKRNLPFAERVNLYAIDSLLKKELTAYNISLSCEWGVYSVLHNKFIVQRTGKYRTDLNNSGHIFKLFPSDKAGSNVYYLILYFPKEGYNVLSSVFLMLIVSLLMFIFVIFVFAYTLRNLFRMRRLADVKATFINHITHELKTPISTISLVCEAMQDKEVMKSESFVKKNIAIIRKQNEILGESCGRIIKIAKLEKGEILLKKENVSIHEIIQKAIEQLSIQIESKNAVMNLHFDAQNDVVQGDFENLTVVFKNLIDNALKYNNNQPLINIFTQNMPDKLQIVVQDNGIGIHKNYFKKIFDIFFRVQHGDVHSNDGFGLGLSFVKLVVEKLGGSIKVESEENNGTSFEIML
ncbi:sensor protein RprX [Bacteroidia bacterium]|nr:sensor protein RprX [Bacteroidia bacterium]GHV42844.1 sensor protein RprX [Bacteroidia bacterium]